MRRNKKQKTVRRIAKRFLILSEDKKSSLSYFKAFRRDEEFRRKLSAVNIEVCHPKNYSPKGLVDEAKKRRNIARREKNPYDEIWLVLDKDQHSGLSDALKMAKDNGIEVALSIICFEFWILLHFEKTTKPFNDCDSLEKYIQSKYYPKYSKKECCFVELKDKMQIAIDNAKWVRCQFQDEMDTGKPVYEFDAYTDVDKLVEKLLNSSNNCEC